MGVKNGAVASAKFRRVARELAQRSKRYLLESAIGLKGCVRCAERSGDFPERFATR
jgi:hypothetical protein